MTEPAAPKTAPDSALDAAPEAEASGTETAPEAEAATETATETAAGESSTELNTPAPPARSRLRRLAPFVLLAGAAVSAISIHPHLPREPRLELRLEEPSTIIGVRLDWSTATSGDEPLQGATWRFAPGSAPRLLPATVRLPDGSYDVDIRVERVDQTQTVHRSITLGDADRITVPVR